MSSLCVQNLSKSFLGNLAVSDVSFTIEPNEVFGLIGPNGAGKTTTLRMIASLLRPGSGTIRFGDLDAVTDCDAYRQVISYLPEDAGVYRNLTGMQYLTFIARFFEAREPVADIVKRGVEICGLQDRLHSRVATYSKGMTRKLVIARALMVRPQLAILDEPTSGLDVISATMVRGRIRDAAGHGAVLLSSHNLLEVEQLCQKVAFLLRGRVLDCGSPEQLREKYGKKTLEEIFLHLFQQTETPAEKGEGA